MRNSRALRRSWLLLCLLDVGGCSYGYRLTAVAIDGKLAFVVSTEAHSSPDCFRSVEVSVHTPPRQPTVEHRRRDEERDLWRQTVSYDDDCANRFPLVYGSPLRGIPFVSEDREAADAFRTIPPRELQRGVWYDVRTNTGATGYGHGRFLIAADGSIQNDPAPSS